MNITSKRCDIDFLGHLTAFRKQRVGYRLRQWSSTTYYYRSPNPTITPKMWRLKRPAYPYRHSYIPIGTKGSYLPVVTDGTTRAATRSRVIITAYWKQLVGHRLMSRTATLEPKIACAHPIQNCNVSLICSVAY